MGMTPYVIKAGDFFTKLAFTRGFDADTVWNDPKNADIRNLRKPDVLCTGDVVYLPDTPTPGLAFQKRVTNKFEATVPTIKCSVGFRDDKGPFATEAFVYKINGVNTSGTTDGQGAANLEVPITCHDVLVYFPARSYATHVQVGQLDPISEPSGLWQRLQHLGYLKDDPSAVEDDNAQAIASALRAYQTDQKIAVSGQFDDVTKNKLLASHGA